MNKNLVKNKIVCYNDNAKLTEYRVKSGVFSFLKIYAFVFVHTMYRYEFDKNANSADM